MKDGWLSSRAINTPAIPARCAPAISDSSESPTMAVRSRPAWRSLSAKSNIAAEGLPTIMGSTLVVTRNASTIAPVPGNGPFGEGKEASALVATKRAPANTWREACRRWVYETCSSEPTTTASQGSLSMTSTPTAPISDASPRLPIT